MIYSTAMHVLSFKKGQPPPFAVTRMMQFKKKIIVVAWFPWSCLHDWHSTIQLSNVLFSNFKMILQYPGLLCKVRHIGNRRSTIEHCVLTLLWLLDLNSSFRFLRTTTLTSLYCFVFVLEWSSTIRSCFNVRPRQFKTLQQSDCRPLANRLRKSVFFFFFFLIFNCAAF